MARRISIAIVGLATLASTLALVTPSSHAAGESGAVVFCDVPTDAFHAPAVAWAGSTGIVRGVNPERFGPDEPVSRAQMVTFLHRYVVWRDRGPTPTSATHGFADVPTGTFYQEALRWAVGVDLVAGYDADHFGPDQPLDRAQLAVFVHRLAGAADQPPDHRFADVPTDAWYASAVTWMADGGLTRGTGPSTYSPGRTATRAEIVTFLWRMAGASRPPPRPRPLTVRRSPHSATR